MLDEVQQLALADLGCFSIFTYSFKQEQMLVWQRTE